MVLKNRPKYKGGHSNIKTQTRLPINFDIHSLNLMCAYVLSENRNIRRGHYINLRNVMELLDLSKYANDPERLKRITFIKKGIEGKVNRGLSNPLTIIKYINGGIMDDDIIDINSFADLSNSEVEWINETISNTLSSTFIYDTASKMIEMYTEFLSADSTRISELSTQIQTATFELCSKFRQARRDSALEKTFSLRPDIFDNVIRETHEEITSNYRYLYTGMQGFNALIGGGFENTRLYLLLGITGGGKSLSMLDIAIQMKKYNKGFKPKDPTKIPCIVYLTMENSVTETIQRMFEICTGESMKNFSVEEIERKLKEDGELYLSDESPIDIIIKYRPNRSEDTSYLYTLTEDLEDEGYEVIALLQDHIKRLRSVEYQPDVRLELGNVANEMKTFAIIKDIPVITDSHLNRDGARIIDNTAGRTVPDLTRLLGKSNIGESMLMLDNVDLGIILNQEYDSEGNKYMVFKIIKQRVKIMKEYVCIPYIKDTIKLVEDLYDPVPAFRDTLMATNPVQMIQGTNVAVDAQLKVRQVDEDDMDNSFYNVINEEDMENTLVYSVIQNNIVNEKEDKDHDNGMINPMYHEYNIPIPV